MAIDSAKRPSLSELRETLPFRAFEPIPSSSVRKRPFWWRPKRARGLPIVLTGGIGDCAIAIGLVYKIKLLVKEVELFSDHPGVVEDLYQIPCRHAREFPRFDYSLWLNTVPRFLLERNFRGFSNPAIGDLFLRWKAFESTREWGPLIHRHPYLDNALAHKALSQGLNRETLPYFLLGIPNPVRERIEYRFSPRNRYQITVHDGFETAQGTIGRATKTWGIHLWSYLVQLLRENYPNVKIVQLGGPTSRPIRGVDECLVGKLSLKESFEVLWRSRLHIDGDSGLVHVARLFGVPSVVMFGPTPKKFFGYRENKNITSGLCESDKPGSCFWLTKDWLRNCPAGYKAPICMDSLMPQRVIRAVQEIVGQRL